MSDELRKVAWYRDGGLRSDGSKLHLAPEDEEYTLCGIYLGSRYPLTGVSEHGLCGSCKRAKEARER